ncbi:MAG: TrkH family potassium uptake protein [Coriobacteriales bacterium]|jgi:trk system potassium uptake protein TrkH
MLPRFHLSDISTVGHYLGLLLIASGLLMLLVALLAFVLGEQVDAVAFLFGAGCCLAAGVLLRFLPASRLDRRRSLLLLGIGWIVIGCMSAIPLFWGGGFDSPFDAVFDAVSALTTTGVVLNTQLDHMSYAQATWYSLLSLQGASAIVFAALYYGLFGEGSHSFLEKRSVRDDSRSQFSMAVKSIGTIFGFYLVVGFVALFIICLVIGLSPLDAAMNAFWLVSAALSTGGFLPSTSGVIAYHSPMLEVFLMLFMLVGAVNFGILIYAARFKYKRILVNSELRTYAAWLVLITIALTAGVTRTDLSTTIGSLFSLDAFMVVSSATTTGLQTIYPQQFGPSASEGMIIVLVVAVLCGTCSHSAGGGIKTIRIMQVVRWIGYSITQRIMPQSTRLRVRYEHFGQKYLTATEAMNAMTICSLYIFVTALGAMAFIAHGYDALQSVLEAASLVANCGISTGIASAGMGLDLEIISVLLMWAGRLEFIALIATIAGLLISLDPRYFANRSSRARLREKKRSTRGGLAWRRRKRQHRNGNGASEKAKHASTFVLVAALAGSLAFATSASAATATSDLNEGQVPASQVPSLNSDTVYREMSVSGLLSASYRLDEEPVEFSGEVVGTPVWADNGHKWVNVKQNGAMIGVYLTNEQLSQITDFGSYGHVGSTIAIKGTYHLSCDQHCGELEVHATSVNVTQAGYDDAADPSTDLLHIGLLLIFGALVVFLLQVMFYDVRFGRRRSVRWRAKKVK